MASLIDATFCIHARHETHNGGQISPYSCPLCLLLPFAPCFPGFARCSFLSRSNCKQMATKQEMTDTKGKTNRPMPKEKATVEGHLPFCPQACNRIGKCGQQRERVRASKASSFGRSGPVGRYYKLLSFVPFPLLPSRIHVPSCPPS